MGAWAATPSGTIDLHFERLDGGLPNDGQWRNGFDIADVDGDGHVDLVHGPRRRGHRLPNLFRGRGDGSFSNANQPRFADLPFDYGDIAAADFNGDGLIDLGFAVHLGGVTALLAGPGGDFLNSTKGLELQPPGQAEFSSRAVEAEDWNGDGRIDLVALGEGPARGSTHARRGLAVFLNRKQGWLRVPAPDDPAFGDSLTLGDLDGDGRTDAIIASRRLDDRAPFRLQQDDGTWEIGILEAIRPKSYFPAVLVTDLDSNRVVEFALSWVQVSGSEWRSGIDILRRTSEDWKRTEIYAEEDALEMRALAVGDVNGDSRRDLVVGNDRGEVLLFQGQVDGSLKADASKALAHAGDGCAAYHARLVDIDADGQPELLLAFASEPREQECANGGSLQAWQIIAE